MYERDLRETQPERRELIYDIRDLHEFIDRIADISALVCVPFALWCL